MNLRLILTRHAKSSWDDPALDDHARPLNKRGRKSATAIGAWLARRALVPDLALVSSSARTRETWARIAKELPGAPQPTIEPALYLAEPEEMLAVLRGATGRTIMLIAHNPGTAYLAEGLAAAPPGDSRFHRYPTAATSVIEFSLPDWAGLGWRDGTVTDFVVARDLIG